MNEYNIAQRIEVFELLFDALRSTNSRLEKEHEVKVFLNAFPELKDDWTYILETLNGQHPIGWTFTPVNAAPLGVFRTVKALITYCETTPDKCNITTATRELDIGFLGEFLAPIVNRTLRLGIGKSLLTKSDITPMLAKKYEGGFLAGDVVVTEKLDGNRCIAAFNPTSDQWEFYSRSGKPMKVDFNMDGFDTNLIYDGEVMSTAQTDLSIKRYESILNDADFAAETFDAQLMFNRTSGMINRHCANKKGLVYNIFDIVEPYEGYTTRRETLSQFNSTDDVRILPTLYMGNDTKAISALLGRVTQMGGEGIMLNRINRGYENKRSDALLKYKQVQYMDMKVIGHMRGTGKYADCIGSIQCRLVTDDGKNIICDVGSGLSDAQRIEWANDPYKIMGKIVQIGYHELTQSEENLGTNNYSLRFPRLIKVRSDKTETSEF